MCMDIISESLYTLNISNTDGFIGLKPNVNLGKPHKLFLKLACKGLANIIVYHAVSLLGHHYLYA